MAISTSRDIKLNLEVQTKGGDSVKDLGDDMRGLGTAAGASKPAIDALSAELDALTTATAARRKEEADARSELAASRRAMDDARDAAARLRVTTDQATKATEQFKIEDRAARVAVLDAVKAVKEKQAAVAAAAATSKQAATAEQDLKGKLDAARAAYAAQGKAAEAAAAQQETAHKRVSAGLQDIGNQLRTVQQLAGAALGGQLIGGMIGDLARTADAYSNLSARIKLAAGDGEAFNQAMEGVQGIAQRTGSSLETTADLFTKVSTNTKALGLTTAETLNVVESVSQAIQLSGVSSESAAGALTQFAQALASGTLRGDELNSVLEGSPRLARALAEGLGTTTGALREMGAAGQLTSAQVIGALQGQSDVLRREFEQLPATVGRAITNLSSAWTVYLGEADKATGASSAAASAINFLAGNLDTLGDLLYSAGKAAAAYQTLKLAQTFISIGTAAKTATVEVAAFTAAQNAATAATATSAAGVGRFAALIGGLKLTALATVVTNFREIGTAIGEGAAKLMGYGKILEDVEIKQKADAEASRLAAAERSRYAQETRLAEEAALGLSDVSRALVGAFDDARKKGDSVADSLGKVAKAMNLSDTTGIAAAGAALDVLVLKSKASGEQIREALAAALKGEDLGIFEAQARAAFDGSIQGARRLSVAIDAMTNESLRRAGTSVRELQTGFSATTTAAINDVDALAKSLDTVGVTGERASRLLTASLDQAMNVSRTEEAVKALIQRYEDLGARGLLTGRDLAAGLDAARAKLDSFKQGIDSVDEALQAFGFRSRAEMQATADRLGEAWAKIKDDTTVSLQQQRAAFEQWAAAVTAANRGIEPSFVRLQRALLEVRESGRQAGEGIASGMRRGRDETEGLIASTERLIALQDQQARQQAAINGTRTAGGIGAGGLDADDTGRGAIVGSYDIGARAALQQKKRNGTLSGSDLGVAEAYYNQVMADVEAANNSRGKGTWSMDAVRELNGMLTEARGFLEATKALANGGSVSNGMVIPGGQTGIGGSKATPPSSSSTSSTRTIKVDLAGRTTTFNDLSSANASALEDLLGQLQSAASRA